MPIALALTTPMLASSATAGTVIHVDDGTPAAGDGLTWSTASRTHSPPLRPAPRSALPRACKRLTRMREET